MHGMCHLELTLGKIPPGELNTRVRWYEFCRLIAMSILVLMKGKRWRWQLVYDSMINNTKCEGRADRKEIVMELSIMIVREGLKGSRKTTLHMTMYKYRQWRRIVYLMMYEHLEQLSMSLEKVSDSAWIRPKCLEHAESWKRYSLFGS